MSWQLNLSINLITIRQIKRSSHTYRNILIYKFNNTCIKLLRVNDFAPVNVLWHDKNVYIINNIEIMPKLLNTPQQKSITFKNRLINADTVFRILNNTLIVTFPFKINLYTSYTYITTTSKSLGSNMIGQYLTNSNSEDVLHLFISTNLKGDQLAMHQLEGLEQNEFKKENLFSHPHLTEGNKTVFPHKEQIEKPLNNHHCVCDHEKTELYFPPRKYSNLGTLGKKSSFYFL